MGYYPVARVAAARRASGRTYDTLSSDSRFRNRCGAVCKPDSRAGQCARRPVAARTRAGDRAAARLHEGRPAAGTAAERGGQFRRHPHVFGRSGSATPGAGPRMERGTGEAIARLHPHRCRRGAGAVRLSFRSALRRDRAGAGNHAERDRQRDLCLAGRGSARWPHADGCAPPMVRGRSRSRRAALACVARNGGRKRRHRGHACWAQPGLARLRAAQGRAGAHHRPGEAQADPRQYGPLALARTRSGQAVPADQCARIPAASHGQRPNHQELPRGGGQAGPHRAPQLAEMVEW